MFEKIRLPRDVIWRWCIFLALACMLAYLVGQIFEKEVVYVDHKTRWCIEEVFIDMESYQRSDLKGSHYISFHNGKVYVYTHCEEL